MNSMIPVKTEIQGIQTFCTAFINYFALSQVMGFPANPATLQAPKTAMIAALTGWSQPNASAALIQAAMIQFWGSLSALAPTIWVTAPGPVMPGVIPPVGLSGLAAQLTTVWKANTSGLLPLATANQQIALAIHTANLGGIATVLVPSIPPLPTPTPIL